MLTETAKQIIEQHYAMQERDREEIKTDGDVKDTSLMRSQFEYSAKNPRFGQWD